MPRQDRIYFAQRAAEEMQLALEAGSPDAARAHSAMTRRYLERASVGDRPAPPRDESHLFGDNRASFARIASEG